MIVIVRMNKRRIQAAVEGRRSRLVKPEPSLVRVTRGGDHVTVARTIAAVLREVVVGTEGDESDGRTTGREVHEDGEGTV